MKILQRNLNRGTFVVWEMKRNVSVVRFKFHCNILIGGKIIKEMPDSVASGTLYNSQLYKSLHKPLPWYLSYNTFNNIEFFSG
jgi:hypothetical protein